MVQIEIWWKKKGFFSQFGPRARQFRHGVEFWAHFFVCMYIGETRPEGKGESL